MWLLGAVRRSSPGSRFFLAWSVSPWFFQHFQEQQSNMSWQELCHGGPFTPDPASLAIGRTQKNKHCKTSLLGWLKICSKRGWDPCKAVGRLNALGVSKVSAAAKGKLSNTSPIPLLDVPHSQRETLHVGSWGFDLICALAGVWG